MTGRLEVRVEEPKGDSLDGKRLLRLREAGRYIGFSEWGVRRLIWKGELPGVRIGRKLFVDIRALDAFVEGHSGQGWTRGERVDPHRPCASLM